MDLLGGGLSKKEKKEFEEKFAELQRQIDELKLLNRDPTIEINEESKPAVTPNSTANKFAGKSVTFVNGSP